MAYLFLKILWVIYPGRAWLAGSSIPKVVSMKLWSNGGKLDLESPRSFTHITHVQLPNMASLTAHAGYLSTQYFISSFFIAWQLALPESKKAETTLHLRG